jgi:hypothetical protein
MSENLCEGCFGSCMAMQYSEEVLDCPCVNCLVKVTCMDACEKWHAFFSDFTDRKKTVTIFT